MTAIPLAVGEAVILNMASVAFRIRRAQICRDEKTGMQTLERKHPTQPLEPGKPEQREHGYIRHGTRALIASIVVPTGQVLWNLGQTRTSALSPIGARWSLNYPTCTVATG